MTPDDRSAEPFLAARFRVSWDGREVPGVTVVGPLTWRLESERPDAGERGPLVAVQGPVRLERDRIADDAFEAWARLALRAGAGGVRALRERAAKDVVVSLLHPGGGDGMTFTLRRCTPRAYTPLGGLDAGEAAVPAREILVLDCEAIDPAVSPANGSR